MAARWSRRPTRRRSSPRPQHAYTRALLAATPRYTDPVASLLPVDEAVLAGLATEIAAADKRLEGGPWLSRCSG